MPNQLQRKVMMTAFASVSPKPLTDEYITTIIGSWLKENSPALKEIVAIATEALAASDSYDRLAMALIARLRKTSPNIRSFIASCCLDELIGPNAMRHQNLKERLEQVRDELAQGL